MNASIEVYFLIIAFLASAYVFFQKSTELYLRLFPVYFLITIIVQQLGTYLLNHGVHNVLLYNLYNLSEFTFYFFVLREIIVSEKMRKFILWVLIVFPVLALIYIFFIQKAEAFHSITYMAGCILIVVFCIFYFVELFQRPKLTSLLKEPAFWICTSVLFSYVCTFPLWSLMNFVNKPSTRIMNNILFILLIVNILSYLLITIAFLCKIKIRKSTLQS